MPWTRLAALSLLAALPAGAMASTAAPAQAAPPPERCPRETVDKAAKRADVVVLGEVAGSSSTTTGSGDNTRRTVTYEVVLDRVYRGTLEKSPIRVSTQVGQLAGLPKIASNDAWLFFATGADVQFEISRCSGSRAATTSAVDTVEQALGAGRAWVEPQAPAEQLEYTDLEAGEALPLSRLLAPGAAASIIGLLGLLLFRRKARV